MVPRRRRATRLAIGCVHYNAPPLATPFPTPIPMVHPSALVAAPPSTSGREAVLAVFGVFFVESVVLGNWIPRIPEVKAALGLSDSMLGLCLLAMPLGSFLGLALAGRLIERLGLRDGCRFALPLWALLFMLPAFSRTPWALAATLLVAGLSIALVEVAMNTKADRIEAGVGRRIMSRCHGFWSLGSMTGAGLGAGLAHAGVPLALHFALVMPPLALLGWVIASRLPPDEVPVPARREGAAEGVVEGAEGGAEDGAEGGEGSVEGGAAEGADRGDAASGAGRVGEAGIAGAMDGEAPLFRLPSRAILLLCAMPLGSSVVEGAFIDWSAVFMRSVLDAPPLVIGVAYAFFSSVMAVTRLSGDAIADRVGDLAVVRCSGLAATLGIALFALAPSVPLAFLGAALAGAGVAIVYPLAVTAAARRPGRSPADNVAALTMVSFSAFLLAPPLIGFLSDALGLRAALALLAPVAFTTVLLAGELTPEGRARRAGA